MKNKKNENISSFIRSLLLLIVLVMVATTIGYLFEYIGFPETNIVLVYLLAVLLVVRFSKGYFIGVLASITATLAFNYFFTSPYLSFSVDEPSYMITFVIMTMTSLVVSTLTTRVKQSALEAKEKQNEARTLYRLTNRLTDAMNIDDITDIVVSSVSESFFIQAACIYFDDEHNSSIIYVQENDKGQLIRRSLDNGKELKARMENLHNAYYSTDEYWDWPIYGTDSILGVVRIPSDSASIFSETQRGLLQSMIESISLAMDRFRAALNQMKAHEEAIQERYRSNILRAISHDLRTPLSGIIGTSEMLLDMTKDNDERFLLIESIHKDADWLHSLVENILSLTKLQDGKLNLHKELEPIEEVVGGAVAHIAKRYPSQEISVVVPDQLIMIPMDAKLIQQVIVNLLDNAVLHTPLNEEIKIEVTVDEANSQATFVIIDNGEGLASDQLDVIFRAFYTSRNKMPDAKRGIGLGLTICEAIVKAHGGSIEAHNRADAKGACFTFSLPRGV